MTPPYPQPLLSPSPRPSLHPLNRPLAPLFSRKESMRYVIRPRIDAEESAVLDRALLVRTNTAPAPALPIRARSGYRECSVPCVAVMFSPSSLPPSSLSLISLSLLRLSLPRLSLPHLSPSLCAHAACAHRRPGRGRRPRPPPRRPAAPETPPPRGPPRRRPRHCVHVGGVVGGGGAGR